MIQDERPSDGEKTAQAINTEPVVLKDSPADLSEDAIELKEEAEVTQGSHPISPTCTPSEDWFRQVQLEDLEALSTAQTHSPPYSVFSRKQKHFIVFLAAWGGFFSPLSANIYFPALTTLTHNFNVSSTLMNLTLTSYMIFQGLAPTIFGDLADMA